MKESTTQQEKVYSHLAIEEREEFAIELSKGKSMMDIAKTLGRHRSTLYREKKRNGPPHNKVQYRANRAQQRSDDRKTLSHNRPRLKNDFIRGYTESKLKVGWTPELIAGRLQLKKNNEKTNYESIYLWIYTERRDLIEFLVRGHKNRRKRGSAKNKRAIKVPNRTMIDNRPAQIATRDEPGHWEADTAVSRQSKGAICAISERKTRYLIVKKMNAKTAKDMDTALVTSLEKIPKHLCLTITYDNGTENTNHDKTNETLKTKSYFCNPYHSWEKGTIENRIGIIRRVFPKKTDWGLISQEELDIVVKQINTRPMKCLGFKTPEEVFVALTH